MKFRLSDWQERALKTFVQAFLGVLMPEIIYLLQSPEPPDRFSAVAAPLLCSSLAAGLSALWNLLLAAGKEKTDDGKVS